MAAFEYIKADDLYKTYSDAKTFMLPLWLPLDEYERIARNKPHPGIAKELPKVTDGTLASIIQEQPKRVIQQIPTGKVKAPDEWLDIVADFIFEHEIVPNANAVAALIQKCWALVSKSLTYGAQPAFVQFLNRGSYFGTDFTLPYIKDVLLEPGKMSDRDSNVIFLRTWWTPNQIDAVIYKEEMLTKNSKKRGDKDQYESGWNIELLKKAKKLVGQKDVLSMSPNERNKQLNAGFIEIVHVFQRGIGGTFYSFSPTLGDKDNILRTKTNKDPRGQIPVHFMYSNVDLSNPLGRGSVEISGGMQNLLDSEVQSYQYMRALLMNPPLEIKGDVSSAILKYAPAAQWRLGSDPAASVTPVKLETASLQQFPQNYGLIHNQIMQLNSTQDTSTSANTGAATSKTPQGVQDAQQHLGLSDNYVRRQFESVFEEIGETMINLWFAERSGTQDLTLDNDTAERLKVLDPKLVNDKNQVRIDYDTETPKLAFKIDPTSSTAEDKQEQIADLQQLLADTTKNPYIPYLMQAENKELHIGEAYIQLFERYGLKDIDKIITDVEVDPKTGQPLNPPRVMTPFFDKPSVSASFKDLPPAAQVQLLANGGISVQESDVLQPNIEQIAGGRTQNPVSPAYVDQQTGQVVLGHPPLGQPYVDPVTGQPVPAGSAPENHPLINMMTSLGIKFADLPQDSQMEVLDRIGIPTTMATPTTQDQTIKATNAATDIAKVTHQAGVAMDTQANAQVGQQQAASQQASDQESPEEEQTDQPGEDKQTPQAPGIGPDEQNLINELRKRGYPDDKIAQAIALMHSGQSNATIIAALHS